MAVFHHSQDTPLVTLSRLQDLPSKPMPNACTGLPTDVQAENGTASNVRWANLRSSRFPQPLTWVIRADSSHLQYVSALLSQFIPNPHSIEGSGKVNAYLNPKPGQEAKSVSISVTGVDRTSFVSNPFSRQSLRL